MCMRTKSQWGPVIDSWWRSGNEVAQKLVIFWCTVSLKEIKTILC